MFDLLVDFFNHMPLRPIENTHVKFKVFHFRFYEVHISSSNICGLDDVVDVLCLLEHEFFVIFLYPSLQEACHMEHCQRFFAHFNVFVYARVS